MEQNLITTHPLIFKSDGFVGVSKIDGTLLLQPNRHFLPSTPNGLMPSYFLDFCEGVLALSRPDGATGYIDEAGNIVLPFDYESAYPFIDGFAVVKSGGKWGMIDRAGKETVPFIFDAIFYEGASADNRIGVVKNGKFGYVTLGGTEVIPCAFEIPIGRCSGAFCEGVAPVLKNGEVFFIDCEGTHVISLCEQFDYVASFEGGYAQVVFYREDGIYHGYLDRSGNLSVPVQYRQIGSRPSEGLVAVSLDDVIVYTDLTGHIVLKTPYETVTEFHDGVAWGRKNGIWESFDYQGKVLATNVKFDRAIPCSNKHWLVRMGKECRCVDKYGKDILTPKAVPSCPYYNVKESDWVLYHLSR